MNLPVVRIAAKGSSNDHPSFEIPRLRAAEVRTHDESAPRRGQEILPESARSDLRSRNPRRNFPQAKRESGRSHETPRARPTLPSRQVGRRATSSTKVESRCVRWGSRRTTASPQRSSVAQYATCSSSALLWSGGATSDVVNPSAKFLPGDRTIACLNHSSPHLSCGFDSGQASDGSPGLRSQRVRCHHKLPRTGRLAELAAKCRARSTGGITSELLVDSSGKKKLLIGRRARPEGGCVCDHAVSM